MGFLLQLKRGLKNSIKAMVVGIILILLLPVILLKCMLVSTSILFSSAGYSQKDWKSNAIYEVIKIPIYMMDEIYQAVMNKRLLKYSTTKSACGEYIIKGFIYIVGLVVCIGLFLNICVSGYFIANRNVSNCLKLAFESIVFV